MTEIPDEIDLDNQEHVEMVTQEFQKRIAHNEQEVKMYRKLISSAKSSSAPSIIQYYGLAGLVYTLHIETLEALKNYFLGFVILNKDVCEKAEKLEKEIRYISEKTGVDLSEMKTQVAKIKEAVEAPIYKYVKTQQDAEEKRKKLEDELLDWAIRSR
jgi:hypothetical protein